jgi:hypothetical protein
MESFPVAKQQIYPFPFTCKFTQEAGDYFGVADANGLIPRADLLRDAWDMYRANHRWLMSQGHSALTATDYLARQADHLFQQTEARPGQPPAQAQSAPMPSPFGQAPMGVAANGR